MAGDQGVADAYMRYFGAQEEANLQSDPFYQFTLLATQAAQEWEFERKKDQERAKKKAERATEKFDEMFTTSVDGWNPKARELFHQHTAVFTEKMNQAILNKDKKAQATIEADAREFAAELQR